MEQFFATVNSILVAIDDFIWGVPLMVLILAGGILLTVAACAACSLLSCPARFAT